MIDEAAELHVSLKVIGQGCKQHLTGYLRSGAASELPQPAFAFDPSVRKLGHSCALASLRRSMLASPANRGFGLWISDSGGHLGVHFHYAPMTCSPSHG